MYNNPYKKKDEGFTPYIRLQSFFIASVKTVRMNYVQIGPWGSRD